MESGGYHINSIEAPSYSYNGDAAGRRARGAEEAGSWTRTSSKSSDRSLDELEASPRGAGDVFGLEAFCGACCAARPKGFKVKRLHALEYATLLEAMDVDDTAADARAYLSPFLARFPYRLHPLVRPVFFYLGQGGEVSENAVDWMIFVDTLSRMTHGSGPTWSDLLEAFESYIPEATVQSAVQNAACLCFYFAHPYLAYSPDDVLTETALPNSSDGRAWSCNSSWTRTPRGSVFEGAGSSLCASERMKIDSLLTALEEPAKAEGYQPQRQNSGSAAVYDCRSLETAKAWLEASLPCLPLAFDPQLANTLMGTPLPRDFPIVETEILDAGLAFLLRATSSELWESEAWTSLFDDRRDGRSFTGLLHSLQHYKGPVALLIRTENGEVLGSVSKYWVDANGDFGGGPDCYLFALAPTLVVCRASGTSNYAYVNSRNRSKVRGLGFGGKVDWFRLFLDNSLDSGYVLQGDMTYQRAALLPGAEFQTNFKVARLELWGCGSTGAKADQKAQKMRVEKMSEKARQVDKAKLLRGKTDTELFLPKTFKATADAREETGVVERRASARN